MERPYANTSPDELLRLREEKKRFASDVAKIDYEIRQRELEDNIKKLTKPHWTLTPTFWLVLVTSFLTLISTAILVFQFWQSFFPEKKSDLNKPPVQTNSPVLKPTETQQKRVSQPTTFQEKKKSSVSTKKQDVKSQ